MKHFLPPQKPPEIARLYEAFAVYRSLATAMCACSCCVKRAEVEALFSAPLALLPPDRLQRYVFKAITTWGDENDFRHFLPRLLELALGDGLFVDCLANDFEKAGWPLWAEAEVETVRAFWPFAVEWALQNEAWVLADWFAMWVRLGEDLAPLLSLLERADDPVFLEAVTSIVWNIDLGPPLLTGWLRSPAVHERLLRAFAALPDGASSWEQAQAIERIEAAI